MRQLSRCMSDQKSGRPSESKPCCICSLKNRNKKTRIVSTLPPKPQKFPESTMSQRNICLKIRTWNRKNSGPIFAQMHQICLDQNLYFLPLSNFDIFVILAIMIFWSKTFWSWMTEPKDKNDFPFICIGALLRGFIRFSKDMWHRLQIAQNCISLCNHWIWIAH